MKLKAAIIFMLLCGLELTVGYDDRNTTSEIGEKLSRRKRYIVFPKGASLQLLLELLVHVPTNRPLLLGPTIQTAWPLPSEGSPSRGRRSAAFGGFSRSQVLKDLATLLESFGTTVGLAWQLPDDPAIYSEFKRKHKIYKRNVYKKMEAYIWPGGADGSQCVLRALCESGQRTPSRKKFLREILHRIFSMGDEEDDSPEDGAYRKAYGAVNQNCGALYPDCPFSVFDAVQ